METPNAFLGTPVIQLMMFQYNDCNDLIYRTINNNVITALMSELCIIIIIIIILILIIIITLILVIILIIIIIIIIIALILYSNPENDLRVKTDYSVC